MKLFTSRTTNAANSATAWLVRHGQSMANAGHATGEFKSVPLTDLGRDQAELFAQRFDRLSAEPPTLIVHSPYLRACDTASPTVRRFPNVPVETWPIQEFSYLDPAQGDGLTERQREPFNARYWRCEDPAHREGPGAESFNDFLDRVRAMLARLSLLVPGDRVVLFTHGYVMQAVRLLLLFPAMSDRERMLKSRLLNDVEPIANTEILELRTIDGAVRAIGQEHITPLTLEGVIVHE